MILSVYVVYRDPKRKMTSQIKQLERFHFPAVLWLQIIIIWLEKKNPAVRSPALAYDTRNI